MSETSDTFAGPHIDADGVFHHGAGAETVDIAAAPRLDLAALRAGMPDVVQVRRELPRLRQLLVAAHLIEHFGPDHPGAQAAVAGNGSLQGLFGADRDRPIPSAEALRQRIAELEAPMPSG